MLVHSKPTRHNKYGKCIIMPNRETARRTDTRAYSWRWKLPLFCQQTRSYTHLEISASTILRMWNPIKISLRVQEHSSTVYHNTWPKLSRQIHSQGSLTYSLATRSLSLRLHSRSAPSWSRFALNASWKETTSTQWTSSCQLTQYSFTCVFNGYENAKTSSQHPWHDVWTQLLLLQQSASCTKKDIKACSGSFGSFHHVI